MKRRYRDIKQRMQQKVPRPAAAKHDDALGQVLDDLNAWGFLADQQQTHHERINCFGPGIFRGYLPITWAGVAIWYKPRGYYFYDTLSLIGIWTLRAAPTQIDVTLGVRQLRYALPFFNPESYYYRIQQEFRTAYKDDGSPPTEAERRYTATYDPERRLEIRRALEDELIFWAVEVNRS